MSMRVIIMYVIGLLLIGLLIFLAIPYYESRIPQTLVNEAKTNLKQQGYDWAEVKASGRDLTIIGKAPTLEAHSDALALVKRTKGMRLLTDDMTDNIIRPYTMNLEFKDDQLTGDGYMPDEATQQSVLSRLNKQYGQEKVSVNLDVGGGEPEKWTELIDTLVTNLPNFNVANIELADKQLDIAAKTPTTEHKEQLLRSLKPFNDVGYVVKSRLIAADAAARLCQKRFDEIMSTGSIIFASNKSRIANQSIPFLESIVETTQFCPDVSIQIAGHTDNVGNESNNLKLSQKRAESVGRWLIQAGVNKEKIRTQGYGSSQPITDNSTEAGRAKNRRIQFTVGNN